MPRVIFSTAAIADIQRLRAFIAPKNPAAAQRAGAAIVAGVQSLKTHPRIGRIIDNMPEEYRELLIPFGDSGYVARYHIGGELVTILLVRHQREAGY